MKRAGLLATAVGLIGVIGLLSCGGNGGSPELLNGERAYSGTTTILVPIDEHARVMCRDIWNQSYCTQTSAQAAIDECAWRVAERYPNDGCGRDGSRCFRGEFYAELCIDDPLIYPDAASCQRPRRANCSFYSACVEAETNCGEGGYALGYGERYCLAFKNLETLTSKGDTWRDGVMTCLQEQLADIGSGRRDASCSEIESRAIDSHVACYTQPENSICFLPPADITKVLKTIGALELVKINKQVRKTIGVCAKQIGGWFLGLASGALWSADPNQARLSDPAALRAQYEFWQQLAEEYGVRDE